MAEHEKKENAVAAAREDDLFDPQFLDKLRALFFKLRKRKQLRKKGIQSTNGKSVL